MPRYYDDTIKTCFHSIIFCSCLKMQKSLESGNSASLLWVWPMVSAASACDLRAVLVSLRWDFPWS